MGGGGVSEAPLDLPLVMLMPFCSNIDGKYYIEVTGPLVELLKPLETFNLVAIL